MIYFQIFGKPLSNFEIEALRDLVELAGCQPFDIAIVGSVSEPIQLSGDQIILVLGTPATCDDVALEPNLKFGANGARRIIWIWPDGGSIQEPPPAATKYCFSIIPWDAEKLREVVTSYSVSIFEDPEGNRLPVVPTERNLCVDEDAK